MIRELRDLNDASVIATDGSAGRVSDFLFDDRTWTLRYLVADVGNWMVRHNVEIPVEAIRDLNWGKKQVRVQLTRAQVQAAAGLDSRKPVSKQQELAVRKFYGWPASWHGFFSPVRTKHDFPPVAGDDPHLRSAEEVGGYAVWDFKELGNVASFIMDDSSWHIGYLGVQTGGWLHHHMLLIPTPWVESISWSQCRVSLQHKFRVPFRALAG